MDQKRPVYALVLGALRQEFECYTTISYLCELKNDRVIDGIVISTWKHGVDRYLGLRNKLTELGVVLVESEPLDEDSPYGNLNYLRQSRQLKAALAVLPKDCVIITLTSRPN